MLKLSDIKELIKLVDQTSVSELEIENEGTRLMIRKPGKSEVLTVQPAQMIPTYQTAAPVPQMSNATIAADAEINNNASNTKADTTEHLHKIVSPMVGTFYRSPSPETGPYVNVGDKVNEKTTVCIIEAMKLMNELEAEVKGEIVEVLAENGQLIEFGQPLFLVKPE